MAKYNWEELEKEYILGDYNSVNDFLKSKKIAYGSGARKNTKDWKVKKSKKSQEKSEKVIKKVIEKESTIEANEIVTVNGVAKKLLSKIEKFGDVNERNIKSLTSALKDINDIISSNSNPNEKSSFANEIEKAWKKRNE